MDDGGTVVMYDEGKKEIKGEKKGRWVGGKEARKGEIRLWALGKSPELGTTRPEF